MSTPAGREAHGGSLGDALHIQARCPQCDAEGRWGLFQTLARCAYCDSALWWPRDPSAPEYFHVADRIHGPDDLLDVLLTYDAYRETARLRGVADPLGTGNNASPNGWIASVSTSDLESLKAKRRRFFSIEAHYEVYAPYLMVQATLVYSALGRPREEGPSPKIYRPFSFLFEEILPAYRPEWNFRDRGLWFSSEALTPMGEDLVGSRAFLKPREMQEDARAPIAQWLGRRQLLNADLEPIFFQGDAADLRFLWIFRPFHFVRAMTPEGTQWLLVDGQFRTLAGRLTAGEVAHVESGAWNTLSPGELGKPGIRQFPCHCPVCAAEVAFAASADRQLCRNCGRLLEPTASGFKERPYEILSRREIPWWPETPARAAWLPFWQTRGTWSFRGVPYPDYASLLADLMAQAGIHVNGPMSGPDSYLFPAFQSWIYDGYDRWTLSLGRALCHAPAAGSASRFFTYEKLDRADYVILPSCEATLYGALFLKLVPAFLSRQLQMHLNPVLLKELYEAQFQPVHADLLYLPVPITSVGDLSDRLIGPEGAVDFAPVKENRYPPGIHRTVRRWNSLVEEDGTPQKEEFPGFLMNPLPYF